MNNFKDSEVIVGEGYNDRLFDYEYAHIHKTAMPHTVGLVALDIVKAHAMIAAIPDGEDSAGRAKLRLPTADELTTRACDIAAEMWIQFQKRDWMFDVPLPTPRKKAAKSA
jgi:hypothetical protein